MSQMRCEVGKKGKEKPDQSCLWLSMSAGHWTQDLGDIHISVMEEETVKQLVCSVIVGSYCTIENK